MKSQLTILLILALGSLASAQSITPEVVSSGGGDTTNANVGLSWTIGEPVGETQSGSNGTITQGFHQSHFEIVSLEEHSELGYEIVVYPNPTTDYIQIELKFNGELPAPTETKFNIALVDHAGKKLLSEDIKNKLEYAVSMSEYAQGQYFLTITSADGLLYKSAQITKL